MLFGFSKVSIYGSDNLKKMKQLEKKNRTEHNSPFLSDTIITSDFGYHGVKLW